MNKLWEKAITVELFDKDNKSLLLVSVEETEDFWEMVEAWERCEVKFELWKPWGRA